MTELTDAELVQSALRGDGDAFGHLYRRFYPRLVRLIVRKTGDEALAEDVAQEAVLRALYKLDTFDNSRPLWPWLKAIATNLAADAGRKRGREIGWEPEDAASLPAKELLSFEDGMVLAQALAKLPERQRVAVSLRYLQDWESAEAASFLGLSIPAFEQLLFRARKRLRLEYSRIARGAMGVFGGPGRWLREEAARLAARWPSARRAVEAVSQLGTVTWAQATAGSLAMLAALPAAPVASVLHVPPPPALAAPVEDGAEDRVQQAGAGLEAALGGADLGGIAGVETQDAPPPDAVVRLADNDETDPAKDVTDPNNRVKDPEDVQIIAVAFAPASKGKRAFAIGESHCVLSACPPVLFSSFDGGATWRRLPARGFSGYSLVLPPGSDGTRLFAMSPGGLQVSDDGGRTFSMAALTGNAPLTGSVAVSPAFDRGDPTMLIGAKTLLRYDDANATIQPQAATVLNGPFEPAFTPTYPTDRRFLMGGVRVDTGRLDSTVFTCNDSSRFCTWTRLRGGRGAPKIRFRRDYARSNVAYAFTDNAIFRSSDVWGFTRIETPWPDEGMLLDLVLMGSGEAMLAAVLGGERSARGGLYRSDDGGTTWTRVRSRLFRQGATAIATDGNRILVSLGRTGVACTADGGLHWSRRC